MGKWIAHVVKTRDVETSCNGIIGFTADLAEVNELLDYGYEAVTTDEIPDRAVVGMGADSA